MEATYISPADTAKLIRAALKRAFPGVKFSVRTSTYSMGASVSVGWTDGPTQQMVDAVAKRYAGGRFDGMIDMGYSVKHWLLPDGSATIASNPGSKGAGGVDVAEREWMPSPDAKLVRFCADYVHCNRTESAALLRRVLTRLQDRDERFLIVSVQVTAGGHAYMHTDTHTPIGQKALDDARQAAYRFMSVRAGA